MFLNTVSLAVLLSENLKPVSRNRSWGAEIKLLSEPLAKLRITAPDPDTHHFIRDLKKF